MKAMWRRDVVKIETTTKLTTTGGVVWPASVRLLDYLESSTNLGLEEPGVRVLELGAGCGELGMTLALNLPAGARVCLTEMEYGGAFDHLAHNVALNAATLPAGAVVAAPCDWSWFGGATCSAGDGYGGGDDDGDGGGADSSGASGTNADAASLAGTASAARRVLLATRWDLIVGADLVYNHVGSRMLPRVLAALAGPDTQILYAHTKHRYDALDVELLEQLDALGFDAVEVREPGVPTPPPSPPLLTDLFPDMRVVVFTIRRRRGGGDGGGGSAQI